MSVIDRPTDVVDAPSWQLDAACAEPGPDLWFPGKGQSTKPGKVVCERCLVRSECLAFAQAHDIRSGIWGGLTWPQRKALGRENQDVSRVGRLRSPGGA